VPYPKDSPAGRLLADDPEVLGHVIRWISLTLTSPRFWSLRREWPDVVQEVLTRLVESLRGERFDAARDLRVYVQGIARIVGLQRLSRRPEPGSSDDPGALAADAADNPEAQAIDRQLARRILDLSSKECRELFRLHFFEARSHQEIAAILDVPVGTVKSRLFRCLEAAHQEISRGVLRNRDRVRS
jgi:RNA polymerase sigma factor (sigma-70 family)